LRDYFKPIGVVLFVLEVARSYQRLNREQIIGTVITLATSIAKLRMSLCIHVAAIFQICITMF
jgi:hypothetical protein